MVEKDVVYGDVLWGCFLVCDLVCLFSVLSPWDGRLYLEGGVCGSLFFTCSETFEIVMINFFWIILILLSIAMNMRKSCDHLLR